MQSTNELRDSLVAALDMARTVEADGLGLVGYGVIEHRDGDGRTIQVVPFTNLITDYGDLYYASKGIAGVAPAAPAAPTAVTGMQIGSSAASSPSKAGAGAAMGTLLAGVAFDSGYPQVADLGSGLGVNMVYRTTFAAGIGTGSVVEATITNGTISVASTAGNTISRVTFTAIAKGSADSLSITWSHKQLGS